MSTDAITVRDLERHYGSVRALRGVDFRVPEATICGLVGPNGAGKTTTLRILATDLLPHHGEVEVLGCRLPEQQKTVRPSLGYMPDGAGFYPELSLQEYLSAFAGLYGLRGADRRRAVATALSLAGAEALTDRRLGALSKGQGQRVLLARALINLPRLLILDEPAAGLDPRARVELRELLQLLAERGTTILVSSHILAELDELARHFVVINEGRVAFCGNRQELAELGAERAVFEIQVLDRAGELRSLLESRPDLSLLSAHAHEGLAVDGPGDPTWARDFLRDLVASGVSVVSFRRRTETLEDIYLRLTDEQT